MNRIQLDFVMDLLNIKAANKREGLANIIINGDSAYSVELFHSLPKNTINRDAIKCSKKWGECLDITEFVKNNL
jgi:hypothetical protein